MNAVILTIGDELLIGQVTNSNAAWMGEQLTGLGVNVVEMITIADTDEAIRSAMDGAVSKADLLIATGGLGPTHDDITKSVVAKYLNLKLEFRSNIYEEIVRRFEARNIPVAETNRGQAMVPVGFEVLPNPIGTAPGLMYVWPVAGISRRLILLPGVPREMKRILGDHVFPLLAESDETVSIVQKTLLSTGIGESNLNELIGDISHLLDGDLKLAFLPNASGVRMRISAYAKDEATGHDLIAQLVEIIREKAGEYIYGEGEDTLEEIVGNMLVEQDFSIATAESCTGGAVADRLTNVAGSSRYVAGGVIAYSNSVKTSVLGVDADIIEAHGAVSRQVVTQMANSVRTKFGTDIGIATSGIMGPGGGSDEKPVGTVWIAYSDSHGDSAIMLRLTNERVRNKERTVTAVLNMVRIRLRQGR